MLAYFSTDPATIPRSLSFHCNPVHTHQTTLLTKHNQDTNLLTSPIPQHTPAYHTPSPSSQELAGSSAMGTRTGRGGSGGDAARVPDATPKSAGGWALIPIKVKSNIVEHYSGTAAPKFPPKSPSWPLVYGWPD